MTIVTGSVSTQARPLADPFRASHIVRTSDPFLTEDIEDLVSVWLPLTTLMNSLNNAVGRDDAYPFVLTAPMVAKLGYIHNLIRDAVAETYVDLDPDTLITR